MAAPTYTAKATVLRKTKLGESDLIVTMLAEDGSQLRAVAKGARKPGGSFAGRLELYNTVDLLLSQGKSLDIVKEARIVESHPALASDISASSAAAVCAELAEKITQPSLVAPRMFDLTRAAFESIGHSNGEASRTLACAYALKCLAISGMRPNFTNCSICGNKIALEEGSIRVAFSYEEGGAVCSDCSHTAETVTLPAAVLAWANTLMFSTFKEISDMEPDPTAIADILQLMQLWCSVHVGSRLKSLKFLLTVPLA